MLYSKIKYRVKLSNFMRIISVFGVSLALPLSLSALEINVIDQNGKPVSNAVIVSDLPNKSADNLIEMDQIDQQFSPYVLIAQAGQSVSFPNKDNIRHHVYSFSKPKVFEIRLYNGVPSKPIVFDEPGVIVLGCNIHDHMVGYIYVADNQVAAKSDSQGIVILPDTVAESELAIWHPGMTAGVTTKKPITDTEIKNKKVIISIRRERPLKKNSFKNRFKGNNA